MPSLTRCAFRVALLLLLAAAPVALAQTALTGNLLTNPGAESGLTGWTTGGGVLYLADSGTYDPGYNPHSGSFQFVAGASAGSTGVLFQTVSLGSLSAPILTQIDAGQVRTSVSLWINTYYQGGTPDTSRISLTFLDSGSLSLGNSQTPNLESSTASGTNWQNYTTSFALPAGTRSIRYEIISDRGNNGGTFIDAFTDDHSLQLVSAIPEPSTYALLAGFAGLGVAILRHRRNRRDAPTSSQTPLTPPTAAEEIRQHRHPATRSRP